MINRKLGSYLVTNFVKRAPGFDVFRASVADTPGQRVFVKRIPRDGAPSALFEETLTDLAERLAALESETVLRHRELLFDSEAAYLVGDAINGQTLTHLVQPSGIHSVPHVLGLFNNAATALSDAHARGLLHGGLNADQVIYAVEKYVRVDGFGLLEALSRLGLPGAEPDDGYRAPEARPGEPSTVAAEVHALGSLLVHLLTGAPPDPEQVLQGVRPEEQLQSRRPDLPQRVVDLVARATAAEPEARFRSVAEMRDLAADQGSRRVAPPAPARGAGGLVQIGGLGRRPASAQAPVAEPPAELPATGDLPEMVLIPAGVFRMGNATRRNESPVQEIDLPAFEIGRLPVTNRQYRRYCDETGQPFPDDPPGWGAYAKDSPDHPVINVSFGHAVAYCHWLSEVTGQSYRLPRETEWEKAARGGLDGKIYPWGDEDPDGRAHFGGRAYAWEITMHGPQTRRVGCFAPNGYGLYDMAGNVWEWCDDHYAPYGAPKRHGGIFRIARGGCWSSDSDSLRCAFRMSFYHTTFDFFIGFRCARSV